VRQLLRIEDDALLAGAGDFADDGALDGELHGAMLRSPHAHALVRQIDVVAARGCPGVVAIYTARDLAADGVGAVPFMPLFKRPDGSPMTAPARHALQGERVRFVGDPVAFVVAQSRESARDAAEAIEVDYEALPATTDARDAGAELAAGAQWGDRAATDAAFARASRVVSLELRNQRLSAAPLEPRACRAAVGADGRLTLHCGTQNPAVTRKLLAEDVLKVPQRDVRVRVGDIGGSFSVKSYLYPEDILIAYAARKLGRPVRWRSERGEAFLSDAQGRDHWTRAELALDPAGRFLALRVETLANMGAYLTPTSAIIPLVAYTRVPTNTYDIPAAHIGVRAVLTNTVPVLAHRGAGRPEAIYLIERLVDCAAREIGADPLELRRRNLVPVTRIPYRNAIGETYDSGDFPRLLERATALADAGRDERRESAAARGRIVGRGVASYVEWTGGASPTEPVEIRVDTAGGVELLTGTQAMGQGLATCYVQLAAARLGLPPRSIRVVQGDTDRFVGGGSIGSRSLFTGGSALVSAADALVEAARGLAAEALEAAPADLEYREGAFRVKGTDRSVALAALAARQPDQRISSMVTHKVDGASWPNGCHVCEVELDPETGEVAIARYVALDDVGTVVNAAIVEGQLHGGIAHGAGQALFEEIRFDRESGQLLSGSFMDYALPRASDLPPLEASTDETTPCRNNRLGAKGAGEAGAIAAPAAIANAVMDALACAGVRHLDMPLTPERVWRALRRNT
jgi:carbon-monoxide dehydrogenase large subunit